MAAYGPMARPKAMIFDSSVLTIVSWSNEKVMRPKSVHFWYPPNSLDAFVYMTHGDRRYRQLYCGMVAKIIFAGVSK
jgi:hypothetical protein